MKRISTILTAGLMTVSVCTVSAMAPAQAAVPRSIASSLVASQPVIAPVSSVQTRSSSLVFPTYVRKTIGCSAKSVVPLHMTATRIAGGYIHVSATWGGDKSYVGPDVHVRLQKITYGSNLHWYTYASTTHTSANFKEHFDKYGLQTIYAEWKTTLGNLPLAMARPACGATWYLHKGV